MMRNSEGRMIHINDGNTALDPVYMLQDRCPGYPESEDSDWILRLVGLAGTGGTDLEETGGCHIADYDCSPRADEDGYGDMTIPELIFAGVSGLIEQICLFRLSGLKAELVPAVTLIFLWFLFSYITAGVMEELRSFAKEKKEKDDGRENDRIQYRRKNNKEIRRSCL